MNSKEFGALLECRKKFEIQQLSLKNGNKRYQVFQNAIYRMCQAIADGKKFTDILTKTEEYLHENYLEEWFLLSWQKRSTIEKDCLLFRRFLEFYFQNLEYRGNITANETFQVPFEGIYMGEQIRYITQTANLLIVKESRITGLIICRKFHKPYSYRANKPENKVWNSLELQFLLAGLQKKYPDKQIEVQLVALVSKADKMDLAEFDAKKGDNIVAFTSEEYKEKKGDILNGIRSSADFIEPIRCKDCIFADFCKPSTHVFMKQEKAPNKGSSRNIIFSKEQLGIINHLNGPARVCAGPGSGKTACMVARIENLMNNKVAPEKILAVTFSKKAAEEIRDRILKEDKPRISTLHSLAFEVLISHEALIGKIKLVGKVDSMLLLLRVLEYAPVMQASYEGLTMPYGLVPTLIRDFEFIRRNGIEKFTESYPKKDINGILRIKEIYDDMFRREGYIVYDDIVPMAVQLIKNNPDIRNKLKSGIEYIIVDEAQDLDESQKELILLLAEDKRNLMICGDADQSIYSFRGGSNSFMVHFKEYFVDAADFYLEENHRSTTQIVNAAKALIEQNQERIPLELRAHKSYKNPIYLEIFHVHRIDQLIKDIVKTGFRYSDIAIIGRKNKELLEICDKMDDEIPVDRPKHFLREDYVFCGLLNLLGIWAKGLDEDERICSLLETFGYSPEKKNRNLSIYRDLIAQGKIYDFDSDEAMCYYLAQEEQEKIIFGRIYRSLQHLNKPVEQAVVDMTHEFFDERVETQQVEKWLKETIYERRIEKTYELFQLMSAMKTFEDDTRIYYPAVHNQVHLLTAHDSKGKEYPVVILLGIEEYEKDNTEEGRRLLYVAMTRAKKMLLLTENYTGQSMFLKSIIHKLDIYKGDKYE